MIGAALAGALVADPTFQHRARARWGIKTALLIPPINYLSDALALAFLQPTLHLSIIRCAVQVILEPLRLQLRPPQHLVVRETTICRRSRFPGG
jgi:hypothetical protein